MLKTNGVPLVGYSKDSGDSGIVGHLRKGNFTKVSSTTLQDYISRALKDA